MDEKKLSIFPISRAIVVDMIFAMVKQFSTERFVKIKHTIEVAGLYAVAFFSTNGSGEGRACAMVQLNTIIEAFVRFRFASVAITSRDATIKCTA